MSVGPGDAERHEGAALTDLLDRHRGALFALPGVVGVGISAYRGSPVIEVMVADERAAIPAVEAAVAVLGTDAVVATVTGVIEAIGSNQEDHDGC
jgi:hypothetical protein